jgi:ABC-2 type transport system ATP-binding protein
VTLWPKLSGGEIIDLFARLRGSANDGKRDGLIDRFELDPTKKARTYSKGNRQKVGLIAALASDAELLILDEPTSGLDPLMEEVFEECIHEVKREGRTVLLSSHILAEVEALCDRITIIRSGRTVETGTLTELRHVTRTSVTAHTQRPVDLTNVSGVTHLVPDGNHVTFEVDNAHLDEAIGALGDGTLVSLTCSPPTLEELFLQHYETNADDAAADPVGT